MMVYILHSVSLDRHYVGMADDVDERLRQHNRSNGHWTSQACDWTVVWQETVADRREARELEKRIKARGAARWLATCGSLARG